MPHRDVSSLLWLKTHFSFRHTKQSTVSNTLGSHLPLYFRFYDFSISNEESLAGYFRFASQYCFSGNEFSHHHSLVLFGIHRRYWNKKLQPYIVIEQEVTRRFSMSYIQVIFGLDQIHEYGREVSCTLPTILLDVSSQKGCHRPECRCYSSL